MPPEVRFTPGQPTAPPASDLLAAMVAELHRIYPGSGAEIGVRLDPEEMAPPGGVYLVGRVGEEVVGGGGLRTIGPALGEIKRMYVVPEWRGRGLAGLLLAALEDEARRLAMTAVRLDTGPRQGHAEALYRASGYIEIADYNGNPHASFWAEKRLRR